MRSPMLPLTRHSINKIDNPTFIGPNFQILKVEQMVDQHVLSVLPLNYVVIKPPQQDSNLHLCLTRTIMLIIRLTFQATQ